MQKLFAIIIFLSFQMFSSQNVFKAQKEIYVAQYFAQNNDNKTALKHYQKATELNPKINSNDYLNAAVIAFKIGKNNDAKKLLINSIIQQEAPYDFINGYKSLQPYKETKIFKDVLSNFEFYRDEYYRNLKHPAIYVEIQKMIAQDQLIRSDEVDFEKLSSKIDTKNINRLIGITKKYGWESRAWLILWHQRTTFGKNDDIWNFFIPVLKKEIENENVNKDFFVDFEETANCINGGAINNGAIYKLGSAGNCAWEYSDIKNLDKRRKTVGLPPLYFEYFINNSNTELPKDYKYNKENLLKDLENL